MTLDEIRKRMLALESKKEHTARDVDEAAELMSQYLDHMERLEQTATVKPYLSADVVADKVLSLWSYND